MMMNPKYMAEMKGSFLELSIRNDEDAGVLNMIFKHGNDFALEHLKITTPSQNYMGSADPTIPIDPPPLPACILTRCSAIKMELININ